MFLLSTWIMGDCRHYSGTKTLAILVHTTLIEFATGNSFELHQSLCNYLPPPLEFLHLVVFGPFEARPWGLRFHHSFYEIESED